MTARNLGSTTLQDTTDIIVRKVAFNELNDLLAERLGDIGGVGVVSGGYPNQTGLDGLGQESSSIDNEFMKDLLVDIKDASSNTDEEDTSFLNAHSVSARAVFITLYSLIGVMSLFGNSLVCLVVARNKRMRSVTNFFLSNQALSDMLMTVLNIPFVAYTQLALGWPFGSALCHLADFMGMTSVYVSTFMLTAIALDRHRVIIHPLKPRITINTAVAIAVLIWISAMTLSMPFVIYRKLIPRPLERTEQMCMTNYPEKVPQFERYLVLITFLCQYVIPLASTSGAYVRIGSKLWAQAAVGDTIAQQQAANNRAKRRTTRMLVLVVAVFAVCWCPINMYLIISNFHPLLKSDIVYLWLHWFAMCSVCINPVAFAFLNANFRKELKASFHCCITTTAKNNSRTFGRSTDLNDNSHMTTERPTNGLTRYESVTRTAPVGSTTTGLCNGQPMGNSEAYQMEVKLITDPDDLGDEIKENEV